MFGNKWSKVSARPQIAHRYLAPLLFIAYGVKLGKGMNPVNYAHKVWLRNRRQLGDHDPVAFQKGIEDGIELITESAKYKSLRNGSASPELIMDTLVRYDYIRKCR